MFRMGMKKLEVEIKDLLKKKTELFESNENKRRIELWGGSFSPDVYSPGEIAPIPLEKRTEKKIPITADWDRMQWSKFLRFDIEKYYTDPLAYLKGTLLIDLFRFQHVKDDTPLLKTVPIYLGTAFEPSLFGVPVIYSSDHEPLYTSEGAVIKQYEDLDKLQIPDFQKNGLMPLAHHFYDEISALIPADYVVIFPIWGRSPFGVACAVRGMENLLVDMVINGDFVHRLMRLLNDSRIAYAKYRKNIMKNPGDDSTCWNDECTVPIISPKNYEEFCFPYENELCEFFNGLKWWHSCGSKTELITTMKKFSSPIGFMDLNTWNDDLQKAIQQINGTIPFFIRPSRDDINERNESVIKNNLNGLCAMCAGENFGFRIDGFQPSNPTQDDYETLNRYLSVAYDVAYQYKKIERY